VANFNLSYSTPEKRILDRRMTNCGGKEKYFVSAQNQISVIEAYGQTLHQLSYPSSYAIKC
jgi:hypothetical protein